MTSPKTRNSPTRVSSIVLKTEPKSNERYHSRAVQTLVKRAKATTRTATTTSVGRMAPRRRPGARTLLNRSSPRTAVPGPDRRWSLSSCERTTRTGQPRVCAKAVASPGTRSVPASSSSGCVRSRATPCCAPLRSTADHDPDLLRGRVRGDERPRPRPGPRAARPRPSTAGRCGRWPPRTPKTSSGHSIPSRSASRSSGRRRRCPARSRSGRRARRRRPSSAGRAPGRGPARRPPARRSRRARTAAAARPSPPRPRGARARRGRRAAPRGGPARPTSVDGVVGSSASASAGRERGRVAPGEPSARTDADGVGQGGDPDEPHRGADAGEVAAVRRRAPGTWWPRLPRPRRSSPGCRRCRRRRRSGSIVPVPATCWPARSSPGVSLS